MHDTLANRSQIQYDPYSAEQQYDIQLVAEKFLKGEMEDVDELTSMRQVKELLAQMRNSFRKLKQDGKNFLDAANVEGSRSNISQEEQLRKQKTMLEGDGVGSLQEIGEFGLGIAARDSRPVVKIEMSKEKEAELKM